MAMLHESDFRFTKIIAELRFSGHYQCMTEREFDDGCQMFTMLLMLDIYLINAVCAAHGDDMVRALLQVASYAFTFPDETNNETQIRMMLPALDILNHGNAGPPHLMQAALQP
jgi:hypothetical protein